MRSYILFGFVAIEVPGRWRLDYNHRRPQRALGNRTPAEFASECDRAVLSRVERAQIKEAEFTHLLGHPR